MNWRPNKRKVILSSFITLGVFLILGAPNFLKIPYYPSLLAIILLVILFTVIIPFAISYTVITVNEQGKDNFK